MTFYPDQLVSTRLRLAELKSLEGFTAIASLYDEGTPQQEDFWNIVEHAVARHGVRQMDISDSLGVSQGTVSRWMKHRSHPHPMVAKMVVAWLIADVARRAAMLRAGLQTEQPNLVIPDWKGGQTVKSDGDQAN